MPYVALLPLMGLLGVVFVYDSRLPADWLGWQREWLYHACWVSVAWLLLVGIVRPQWLRLFPRILAGTLIALGGVEALWGLCQLFGLCPSRHALFPMTGSFFNPGPYSGYLALVLPVAVFEALRLGQKQSPVRWAAGSVALLILCVLPGGMSRASWLAAGVSLAFVMFRCTEGKRHTAFFVFCREHRRMLVGVLCLLLCLAAVGIYLLKKDSADGRLLIWKVAMKEVVAHPGGAEMDAGSTFSAVYGNAQERYFTAGDYTVAASPEFAFNDYIQFALMEGVWCPVLLLLIGILAFRGAIRSGEVGLGAALLSLGVFAFFSYPLQLPAFVCTFFLLVVASFLAWAGPKVGRYAGRSWPIVAVPFLMYILFTSSVYSSLHGITHEETLQWTKARQYYRVGAYREAMEAYRKVKGMDACADYHFELGRACYKSGECLPAKWELDKALCLSGDPMILNLLAQNAWKAGYPFMAETYLQRSAQRVPSLTYPYYLLTKLYADPYFYQPDRLQEAARMVLEREPKVFSPAIAQMREEVRDILKEIQTSALTPVDRDSIRRDIPYMIESVTLVPAGPGEGGDSLTLKQ
mgnify:FL=1